MTKPWPTDWRATMVETTLVDEEMLVVAAFRDEPPSHYVVICRSIIPGDDHYVYLERDDQIWAVGDGFSLCRLWKDRIEFRLTEAGKTKLDVETNELGFGFTLGPEQLWELRRVMAVIFAGRSDYADMMLGQ